MLIVPVMRMTFSMQSIPGLVVEESNSYGDAGSHVGDISRWLIVNTAELLEQVMVSDITIVTLLTVKFARWRIILGVIWQLVCQLLFHPSSIVCNKHPSPCRLLVTIKFYYTCTCTHVFMYMFMYVQVALHPRGRREKQLLDSLTLLKTDITTQISDSTHQARVKKFYGSN